MSKVQQRNLTRSAPYFPVGDVDKSASFYERVLGFEVEYTAGTPAQFAIVSRDGFAIMLRLVADASKISPNAQQGGTWDVFFWVDDVQSLHDEMKLKDVRIVYGPVIQPDYGMKEFAVMDADGYVLGFGQQWP